MAAVHSMTGSGTATGMSELGRITLEIRSVNGKSLQLRFRMAPECAGLEPAIERVIRGRLARGSVAVGADITEPPPAAAPSIDGDAFAAAAARLVELARQHQVSTELTVRDVLAVPGVIVTPSSERSRVSWEPSAELNALIDGAVDGLIAHRAAEGAEIAEAMRAHLRLLTDALDVIRVRLPDIVDEHRATILARVNEFLDQHGTRLEPNDVIRDIAQFADRIDVSEELQRLDAHVARLRTSLDSAGPVGRDIEFLLQEILREVNTLGSKSPDVEVAHRVIAMKSAVDKLKEQAANLE